MNLSIRPREDGSMVVMETVKGPVHSDAKIYPNPPGLKIEAEDSEKIYKIEHRGRGEDNKSSVVVFKGACKRKGRII